MHNLKHYLGSPIIGVLSAYRATGETLVYICGVALYEDNHVQLYLPRGHQLIQGQSVTIHLDNRTGVDEYDASLRVYRTSYKGIITQANTHYLEVQPQHFELIYGNKKVIEFNASHYSHASDLRENCALPVTPLTQLPNPDLSEAENKIGVLVTQGVAMPHTTVLAFLSTPEDDIFFISFTDTFKSHLLRKNNHCHFAIDSRAVFTYTKAIEWNYTIIEAEAFSIPKDHSLYEPIREQFVQKNPWEIGFFMAPNVEMFHLQPKSLILPL